MEMYYFPVFIYDLGIMLMNLPILKCLKREAGIWFTRFFPLVVHAVAFFAYNIVAKDLLGGFIGLDNI